MKQIMFIQKNYYFRGAKLRFISQLLNTCVNFLLPYIQYIAYMAVTGILQPYVQAITTSLVLSCPYVGCFP